MAIDQYTQTDMYTGRQTYYTTFAVSHLNVATLMNYIDRVNRDTSYQIISTDLQSRTGYTYIHIESECKLNYSKEKINEFTRGYYSVKE